MDASSSIAIRITYATILTILIAGSFFALYSLVSSGPYGHDEAVYLTKAREWLVGSPADQWHIYRPVGMPIIGWALIQFGEAEQFIRMFGVIFGALTSAVIFMLFYRMTNIWIATATAAVIATSSLFLQQAPQFLNDIPSSLFLLLALRYIYIHYESEGTSNSIYLVAPLIAIAFYMRYGVATPVIIIGALSLFLLLPYALQHGNPRFSKIGRTILLTAIALAPHLVYSLLVTKNPIGILELASEASNRVYIGEGLLQYIAWLPEELGGWPLGVATIAGAFATIAIYAIRSWRERFIGLAWLGGIGLATFIVTGLLTHAEQRYVFFPIVLLVGVGIASSYYCIARYSQSGARIFTGAIIIASFFFGMQNYEAVAASFTERETSPTTVAYSQVLNRIQAEKSGESCSVWLLQFLPRASWYTGCAIFAPGTTLQFRRDFEVPANDRFSIVYSGLEEIQIKPALAEKLGITLTELFRVPDLPSGDMIVYRITENATTSQPQ